MNTIPLGASGLSVPAIAVGCMRITGLSEQELDRHLLNCMAEGLNFFDHADIYSAGRCEEVFAASVKRTGLRREDMFLQSKCGIRPGMYDFSRAHILSSVDGILKRLDTDYLDMLLLHRPDALMEPEEVAEAFDTLERSGKVRYFGVSNHRPTQIELLKKCVRQPICVDQLQFSLPESGMVSSGLEVNMTTPGGADHDGAVLEYCRLKDITVQAWSPFQYGFFQGPFVGNREQYPELNQLLDELAEAYAATPTAIAAAWIFRHPAKIQLIAGTTSPDRMAQILRGSELTLTREDWYRLYLAAGHILP